MTPAATPAAGTQSEPWFRGRPRSWPFFLIGSALAGALQGVPVLVFHRPGTTAGWATWFLLSWSVFVGLALFRNPIYENPFARKLAARTDSGASAARVTYLLAVFLGIAVVLVLVSLGVSALVASLGRS